jgi:hypothetical protein
MVMKKHRSLPFRRNFLAGIALVLAGRILSTQTGIEWFLYSGVILGGALCVADVFKALNRMD